MSCCGRCGKSCQRELHWRKLGFGIIPEDRRRFTHPQWTVIRFRYFVAWKIVIAVYFVIWLALSVTSFINFYPNLAHHEKWLIYLTNWTYLFFVTYVIVAAINVICEVILRKRGRNLHRTWHFGLQWLLWNVGAPATLVVVILFWSVLVPADSSIISSASTIHVHLINGIAILIDQAIHAMPMQLLHLYQPLAYATAYAVFTGIYFASNGTDPTGNYSIYPVITDYSSHTGLAVGADFVIVLIVIPTAWVFLWLLFKLRVFLWEYFDSHSSHRYDLERAWEQKGAPKIELAVISLGFEANRDSTRVVQQINGGR